MKKMLLLGLSTILFAFMLGGCGSAATDAPQAAQNKDPIKLKVWSTQADIPSPETFQELYAKPVQAKYPYITLEFSNSQTAKLADMITQGEIPDIFINSLLSVQNLRDNGLLYDLTPLIKKYNFDLNRIQSGLIKQVQATSDDGQINIIPHYVNFNATYYNKDIFDKFGVPYPKDGMNWDEMISLAARVTRTDGGVQYRGLDPENLTRLKYLYGEVGFVDPKTDAPLVEQFRPAFEIFDKVFSIPGNKPPKFSSSMDPFLKDRTVAMRVSYSQFDSLGKVPDLNWDMVTYPVWKGRADVQALAGGKGLGISPTSKYKEDAFLVIQALLSDDIQRDFMRYGNLSPLKNKSLQAEFGTRVPYLKGKNVLSVFKHESGWYAPTKYDDYVKGVPQKHALELYSGAKDINTVIRESKDEMTKIIQEKKNQ